MKSENLGFHQANKVPIDLTVYAQFYKFTIYNFGTREAHLVYDINHSPLYCGFLFSLNAVNPSILSLVGIVCNHIIQVIIFILIN